VVQLNWTALTWAVIGLFALAGFFKGWWKEAITFGFLAFLLILLKTPSLAAGLIEWVNRFIQFIWGIIPPSLLPTLENLFNLQPNQIPVIDAADPGTWVVIMIFFIAMAIIVSRYALPNHGRGAGYEVRPLGSILGGLLGGLNGAIIMGLLNAYLIGSDLPGGGLSASAAGVAQSGVSIQPTNIPLVSVTDSYMPLVLGLLGLGILAMALINRVGYARNAEGYRRIYTKEPPGYKRYGG